MTTGEKVVREYPRPVLTFRGEDVSDAFAFEYVPPGSDQGVGVGREGGWRCTATRRVSVDEVNGVPTPAHRSDPFAHRADGPEYGPVHFDAVASGVVSFYFRALMVANRDQRVREQDNDRMFVTERGAQVLGELLGLPHLHPSWADIVAAAERLNRATTPARPTS